MTSLFITLAAVLVAVGIAHAYVAARVMVTRWSARIAITLTLLPFLAVALWLAGVPLPWQVPALGAAWLGWRIWRRFLSTADLVTRWGDRARRKAGVASALDVARAGSTLAVRRKAAVVRPSLGELSRGEWWRTRTSECAVLLCRVGPWRVWASIEDVTVVVGGPRTGKTGWMSARVVDSPGACLVTSTRTDLFETTSQARALVGPVFVFNPTGLGGLASTFTFDPLDGCADPVVAGERATDLLSVSDRGDGGGDRQWWANQARRVLAALMHAAALGGLGMRDVLAWVADPGEHQQEIVRLLGRSSQARAFTADMKQFIGTNERTQTSITSSIMPALGWLTNPASAAAAAPGFALDVGELLNLRATVYLLGEQESQCAPLVAALTGYIAREARRLAAYQRRGRLDPPLRLCLDEAALLAPPLESWTADMGGRGVTIIAAFQSRAQLLDRWGEHGSAVILNNTAAVMVFGGTKDKADLDYWSRLAGDRDEVVVTTDDRGEVKTRTTRKAPVVAAPHISNLPAWRALVFRRGMPPAIGRVRMAWHLTPAARWGRFIDRLTARVVAPAPPPGLRDADVVALPTAPKGDRDVLAS